MKPTTRMGASDMSVTMGLVLAISIMETVIVTALTVMSLIITTKLGISMVSFLKRLTASPGESGKGDAPGLCSTRMSRFFCRSTVAYANSGVSAR